MFQTGKRGISAQICRSCPALAQVQGTAGGESNDVEALREPHHSIPAMHATLKENRGAKSLNFGAIAIRKAGGARPKKQTCPSAKGACAMYSTLMVYLDLYRDNAGLLQITANLAERFDASVLGVSAVQWMGVTHNAGALPDEAIDRDREEVDEAIEAVRESFLDSLRRGGRHLDWRAIVDSNSLEAAVTRQARNADLLIAVANADSPTYGRTYLNIGDLVMRSGRPLLVVPPSADSLSARNVLVGWKDTRQARRAVADGLPLLQTADRVLVVEIARNRDLADAREGVADVVRWLKRHSVKAEGMTLSKHGHATQQLDAVAKANGIDLIVAGAYGHRRLREWALGGITQDLLLRGDLFALVSH